MVQMDGPESHGPTIVVRLVGVLTCRGCLVLAMQIIPAVYRRLIN
jgi:hypothetical protein